MKIRSVFLFALLLNVAAITSGLTLAADSKGKMPITTASEAAKADYLKGLELSDKLRLQDSQQFFRKATQEDPNFAVAYLNLAFSEPVAEDFFKDLNQAVAASSKASEAERLWILSADAAAKGQPAQRGQYLRKLVSVCPEDERAHSLLATYLFGIQKYDEAIGEYQKAITIRPDYSPPYNMLGYSYRFIEKYAEAEQAFRKYIELIPNDPNPYDSYAELLMRTGRYDESIDNYRKALHYDSHFVISYVGIASDLNFKGEHEKARAELQELYDQARNDGERRTALGAMTVSYMDEGDSQNAIAQQEKMIALAEKMKDPTTISVDYNTIGIILLETGQPEEAQAKFDAALKSTSESNASPEVKKIAESNYLYYSARVAAQQNDLVKARSLADEFAKQAKTVENPLLILQTHEIAGTIALVQKNYPAAVQELQQSNLQDPYNLYRLALAYQGNHDSEKAMESFRKAGDFNLSNNLNYSLIRKRAKESAGKSGS